MSDSGHPVVRRVREQLELVLRASERDVAQHAALREALDAVPPAGRGRPWREASLLTDMAFRKWPRRTLKRLRRMRDHRGDDFPAFWEECRRALAPYTVGPHGYTLALDARDEAAVWREVSAVMSAVGELGHATFVNSGTLLGLVREGNLIGSDTDADLAVLLTPSSARDVAREWTALRIRLGEAGLLNPSFDNFGKNHCRVLVHGGVSVDLFPAWIADDSVYVWPHTHGELPAAALLPLEQREIAGSSVAVPRHPEPMLELNYGPDWRTPDPTFQFDWPAARARFADFLTFPRAPEADRDSEEHEE